MMETSVRESLLQAMVALARSNAVGNAKEIGAIAIAVNKIDALDRQQDRSVPQPVARSSAPLVKRDVVAPSKPDPIIIPKAACRLPKLSLADQDKCKPLPKEDLKELDAKNTPIGVCVYIKKYMESHNIFGFYFKPTQFRPFYIRKWFLDIYPTSDIRLNIINGKTLFVTSSNSKGD